jgi:1,5-anhydro-D-fructose reductase (1,5-anhydro-D-mannitol-forming)
MRPLKWLVIGIGDITRKRVLPAILAEPRSKLAGIVTRDAAKAELYGVPAWSDLQSALSESSADAVYVATPVFLHASQTIACLEAGTNVLCEKPVAMNYAEAQLMAECAARTGRLLGIAYYRRMYPKVNRARDLIRAGAIGRPFLAEATSHDLLRTDGYTSDWRVHPELAGGGPLYDVASHRIDLMNYLFGTPVRASGQVSTLTLPIAVEDNATVMIEYENGERGLVDVRWHSRVARDEFRIRGVDGEMNLTPLNGPELVYPGGEEQVPAPENLHYPCVAEFVTSCLDGVPYRSAAEGAIWTDWVTERVLRD